MLIDFAEGETREPPRPRAAASRTRPLATTTEEATEARNRAPAFAALGVTLDETGEHRAEPIGQREPLHELVLADEPIASQPLQVIMHQVAKRLLKKSGHTDGHARVNEALDHFEERLGDQQFIVGDEVSLGDVAMHGAMSCVADFPIFATMMDRPKLSAWFERMTAARS